MSLTDSVAIKLISADNFNNISHILTILQQEPSINIQFQEYAEVIIPKIGLKLNRAETRSDGLIMLTWLLNTPLQQDILKNNASKWMDICNSALKNPRQQSKAYNVIKLILKQCSKVHELDRTLVAGVLSEVFSTFLQSIPSAHEEVLKLLEVALSEYPKTCGNHRNVIEKFLIRFIDSNIRNEVILAAKCCHLLQQVGGGGEQGVNYKSAWKYQFSLCIDAVISIASELYAESEDNLIFGSFPEKNDQNINVNTSNVGPLHNLLLNILSLDSDIDESMIADKTVAKTLNLSTRLQNLLIFIQALLVESFQSVKRFNPGRLIQVLVMVLNVAQKEPTVVYSSVDLHSEILNTILAFVFLMRGNILPHINLVCKIILQTLKWSSFDDAYHLQNSFRDVRIKAYDVFINVLLAVQSFKIPNYDSERGLEDEILANILRDALPHKDTLQLKVANESKSNRKKNKKARANKSIENTFSKINLPSKGNLQKDISDDGLAIKSLKCLEILYFVSGNFLKMHNHKMVHEALVELAFMNDVDPQLHETVCKTLLAIQKFTPNNMGTISPYCIALYSKLQSSSSYRVKEFCGFALSQCMESIRGIMPPLSLPVEKENGNSVTRKRRRNGNETIEIGGIIEESSDDEITIESPNKKRKADAILLKNPQTANMVEIIDLSDNETSNDITETSTSVEEKITEPEHEPKQLVEIEVEMNEEIEKEIEKPTEPLAIENIVSTSLDEPTPNVPKIVEIAVEEKVAIAEQVPVQNGDANGKVPESVQDMLNCFVDEVIIDLEK